MNALRDFYGEILFEVEKLLRLGPSSIIAGHDDIVTRTKEVWQPRLSDFFANLTMSHDVLKKNEA